MRKQILALLVIGIVCTAVSLSSSSASAASPAVGSTASQQAALAQTLITTAEQYLGYSYAWSGGSPETGFSCIGLVYYVYTVSNGVPSGRNLDEAYASAPHVDRAHLQPADLVFFSGTVPGMSPLSHVAIYVGNGKMIAADSFETGVEWDDLNSTYWSSHYAGATRPLAAGVGSVPIADQPPMSSATASVAPSPHPTSQVTVIPQATAVPVAATAAKGATLIVTSQTLIVRSGPDNSYMAVATLNARELLTVVQAEDTWYQVSFGDNQFGWVAASAVSPQDASPTATATTTTHDETTPVTAAEPGAGYVGAVNQKMVVSATTLKIHATPGRQSPLVGQLTEGAMVVVLKVQRDWNFISSDNQSGWVFSRYLSADLTLVPRTDGSAAANAAPQAGKPTTNVQGFRQRSSYGVVVVMADTLKVRQAPSLKGLVITQARRGDRLRVVRKQANWVYVMMRGGKTGWVAAQWVRAEDAARIVLIA